MFEFVNMEEILCLLNVLCTMQNILYFNYVIYSFVNNSFINFNLYFYFHYIFISYKCKLQEDKTNSRHDKYHIMPNQFTIIVSTKNHF